LIRLLYLSLVEVVLFCALVGVIGPKAEAQRSAPHSDLAIASAQHETRIEQIESYMRRLEDAKIGERMVKIEGQLDWLEYYFRIFFGGLLVLVGDRIREVFATRKRTI
jgi:hypothetical protein